MTMMSAAPAPIGRCGRATTSINADEIDLKSAPQAVTSVSCQLLGFMGKCSWQGRGSIIPSSGMNIVAVEFMARACLDERQVERSQRSDRPRLLPNLVRNRP